MSLVGLPRPHESQNFTCLGSGSSSMGREVIIKLAFSVGRLKSLSASLSLTDGDASS